MRMSPNLPSRSFTPKHRPFCDSGLVHHLHYPARCSQTCRGCDRGSESLRPLPISKKQSQRFERAALRLFVVVWLRSSPIERSNIFIPPTVSDVCVTVGRRSSLKPPQALPRLAFRIPIRSGRRILARAAPAHELHRAPDFGRACPTSSPCSTAAWMRVRSLVGVLEVAVNENSPPPCLVGEIGLAWKIRDMDAEASAERMYCGPGFHLRVSG